MASSSRIHDAFTKPRLPGWGLVEVLVAELARRVPGGKEAMEEVKRFHGLWEAAAAAGLAPASSAETVVVNSPADPTAVGDALVEDQHLLDPDDTEVARNRGTSETGPRPGTDVHVVEAIAEAVRTESDRIYVQDVQDGTRTAFMQRTDMDYLTLLPDNMSHRFGVGDRIKGVFVTDANGTRFSQRHGKTDPWPTFKVAYRRGAVVPATVTGVNRNGVFVELEGGGKSRLPLDEANLAGLVAGSGLLVRVIKLDLTRQRIDVRLADSAPEEDATGLTEPEVETVPPTLVANQDRSGTWQSRAAAATRLGESGDTAGAAVAYADLVRDRAQVLGFNHPNTLTLRFSAANWLGESGDTAGAAVAYADLARDQARALGLDHPNTHSSRHNAAYWLRKSGDAAGAAVAYADLVRDRARALGPDHPNTHSSRHGLANSLGESGDAAGAAVAYADLARDRARALGPDHPDTLTARQEAERWRGKAEGMQGS
ncbi:tetratricopeptide repeat protein [Streptomyces mirabilis]|uniref:tetratricopeptide repeat protein n=1 Tax=Streptomyces mirabilis TaxID=68239 RepID=UPI002E2A5AFA|nr:tetratricopeptide repeat protein [Streptomyces mirabilis]